MNPQALDKIVLSHMAEEEAAEDKVKRNSIGVDYSRSIVQTIKLGGNANNTMTKQYRTMNEN